jgi:hypothetical protein
MRAQTVIPFAVRRMICTGCGAEANASCTCGVSYIPAKLRVAEYDQANPGKSTRQAAADLNIPRSTVSDARVRTRTPDEAPKKVTGLDGKSYPAKKTTKEPELEPDHVRAHSAFLIRADAAARAAFYALGKIDAEVITAAEETVAVWQRLVGALKGGRYVDAEEV